MALPRKETDMGKFGELEYQFHVQEGFQAINNRNWDRAEKIFDMLLKDNPSVDAYKGLILCHLRIPELSPDAVYVPGGTDGFPLKPFQKEIQSTWYIDNMDEIANLYVVEPYFTLKDLKSCFIVDETIHPVYEWFYYLWRQKNEFMKWWNSDKHVVKATELATDEQKRELKSFYDGVIEKYQLWLDIAEKQLNLLFINKIESLYKDAVAKKTLTAVSLPERIALKPRANSHRYDIEYNPFLAKPKKIELIKKESLNTLTQAKKSKETIPMFAMLGILAVIMIISIALSSLFDNYSWIVPMLIMVLTSVFMEHIYRLVKKVAGCVAPENPKTIQLLSQASLVGTLILALVFGIREEAFKIFFASLFMCVPAFAYYFTNRDRDCKKKDAYIVFAFSLLLSFLGVGFPISLLDNMSHWGVYATQYMDNAWFAIIIVPVLFYVVGMICIHFMPTDECASAAEWTWFVHLILHIFIYDLTPFQLNNLIFRVIWAVVFFLPWALFTQNHLAFSKDIIDSLKKAKPARGSGGYCQDDADTETGNSFNSTISTNNSDSSDPYDAADANARSLGYNDASDAANQLGINEKDLY